MIMMTLNCRGLASKPKKLVVCRLVEDKHVDVLFLQDFMGNGQLFVVELKSMFKGWTFLSLDACGKYGGLLLGWRSRFSHLLNYWGVDSGLCASLFSFELNLDICVVNIYGPYIDKEGY